MFYQKDDLLIEHGSKYPIIYSCSHTAVPLSPKWGLKTMTQEITIHQVQADWVGCCRDSADLTVLHGPCPYILFSSFCLIGQMPC